MESLISVVIPTYRRPQLLTRCLNALSRQELMADRIEVIIVDDGNDADTADAVTVFARRTGIKTLYFGQPQRRGPAAARNRGWQAAKSRIIAFTDDDTIPEPTWLSAAWNEFRWGAQVVTGQVRVPMPQQPSYHDRTTAFLETAEFVTANCFCLKSVLEQVGGFEEAFDIAWREDSDLQFKFLRAGISITPCPAAVINHPLREAPWYAPLNDERKNRYDALLYKRHPELFQQRIPAYRLLVAQYYASVLSAIAGLLGLLTGSTGLAGAGFGLWLLLELVLLIRRWPAGRFSWQKLNQAVLTTLATPFLSVYWRLHGAFTYRVFYV